MSEREDAVEYLRSFVERERLHLYCADVERVADEFEATRAEAQQARAEVERLRQLCQRMADLLEDCRPADATIMWVMGRLDALDAWRDLRP